MSRDMMSLPFKVAAKYALPGGVAGRFHIFIFHRVLECPDPLFPEAEPDIRQFEQIVRAISSIYNVLPLDQAVAHLQNGTLPDRVACVTFDDGYLDNYQNAFPVLKKYKVAATIFIATRFMQGEIMWNDRVIEAIRDYSGELVLPELGVEKIDCSKIENKRQVIETLIAKIKYLPSEARLDAVNSVTLFTGNRQQKRLMMCEKEIIELRKGGLLIGAHTQTHPILTALDEISAMREISSSKADLEAVLGETVTSFAYPNGRYGRDYDQRHVSMVESAGFDFAVSTNHGVVKKEDSIYELPRFTPWDRSINKFMARNIYMALRG